MVLGNAIRWIDYTVIGRRLHPFYGICAHADHPFGLFATWLSQYKGKNSVLRMLERAGVIDFHDGPFGFSVCGSNRY